MPLWQISAALEWRVYGVAKLRNYSKCLFKNFGRGVIAINQQPSTFLISDFAMLARQRRHQSM
jgi:hypothetical protein